MNLEDVIEMIELLIAIWFMITIATWGIDSN